jgi:hypothetical protein
VGLEVRLVGHILLIDKALSDLDLEGTICNPSAHAAAVCRSASNRLGEMRWGMVVASPLSHCI